MYFDTLPNEILTHIYLSLPNIASAINLSATCHRLNSAYHSSKRLVILQEAADAELGPIEDIIQLLTHNSSQPAHIRRSVPISEALIKQIVKVGRIAQQYEEIYPFKKWKTDYGNRRLLTVQERYNLRRTIYRLWLFSRAFHTPAHIRTCRRMPEVMRERAMLLQNFSSNELAEMLDVHTVMRDLVANNICPSNGKIKQKFNKRFPESKHQLLFNINMHLNYPPEPSALATDYYNSSYGSTRYQSRLSPTRWHEPGAEGWGDDIAHYYVIEDMMKLDPEQMLYLRNHCTLKAQVEVYIRGLGEWFGNNGETFTETLELVVKQRGGDLEELKGAIEDGDVGVAVLI
ncbi:hypothetical protein CLAFUW4_06856 [Fulvia fulva]|uniref:F-box domain-containing protein n=1 Tax=Passalora fulva TaxID=5499 RepID=A0A9Q8PBG6_PASFU|nr:uncharacterized protein CLAFUR5_06994 [Fulvia fulva]KAK4621945.1 hypothetical protein CLAFUR4_06864 [Fulvia fulva]KAK4622892.1 hypothetical protein CLAFUR0_06861 [Fulvia fulva]UJO19401.1 hypothetical protein CLAFUR5_06994 [Fulvia fulva]WPV16764.1 hypothetical protein CLAFUW4_06856 [Fulvia fulva]WPV31317.1 hypothetical protein CLAFUW7_06855 [Fulvia fulva]